VLYKSNEPAICYSVRELLSDELSPEVFERVSRLIDRLDSRDAHFKVSPGSMKSCSVHLEVPGGRLSLFSIYRSGGVRHFSLNLRNLDNRSQVTRRQVERFAEPLRALPGLIPEGSGDEIYQQDPHVPVEIVLAEWSAVDHVIDAVDAIRSGSV
jgi:hypothetical protein